MADVIVPPGMQLVLQHKTDFLREIADRLRAADIAVATGPLPGTS